MVDNPLFIVLFGWGGNGWGGNNGGVMDGYVLTSDFANIERKLDSVNNGLCDGFYAMNTGMLLTASPVSLRRLQTASTLPSCRAAISRPHLCSS